MSLIFLITTHQYQHWSHAMFKNLPRRWRKNNMRKTHNKLENKKTPWQDTCLTLGSVRVFLMPFPWRALLLVQALLLAGDVQSSGLSMPGQTFILCWGFRELAQEVLRIAREGRCHERLKSFSRHTGPSGCLWCGGGCWEPPLIASSSRR